MPLLSRRNASRATAGERSRARRAAASWVVQALEGRALLSTFTVNSTADSGTGSLRQAILDADNAGGGTIDFQLTGGGPYLIQPNSALPPITAPIVVDGYSQLGSSRNTLAMGDNAQILIQLDGSNAGGADGLTISGGNATVQGLDITRFNNAIHITGPSGDVIRGDFLGIDPTGTIAQGNSGDGVFVDSAPGELIGGTDPSARDVIGANGGYGVLVSGAGALNNTIQGSYSGTDASGTHALGNLNDGIQVNDGAKYTLIGGTDPGAGNLLSGNQYSGVALVTPDAMVTNVQGNLIGTDVTGTLPLGNSIGVYTNTADNVIGGATAASRNIISGNSSYGVEIYGTSANGVYIQGYGNIVQGNYIGTDINGSSPVGNGNDGVVLFNQAANNTIGGSAFGAGNLISGNGNNGVEFNGSGTTANFLQGNTIGTDLAGNVALRNGNIGVDINNNAMGNIIGGSASGAGNLISGNGGDGVKSEFGSGGNTIQGNQIGTNRAGSSAVPNGGSGIDLNSDHNQIGGTDPGAGNLISGNNGDGIILVFGNASSNVIQGNRIGTDVNGTAPLGNNGPGVHLFFGPSNNQIGGTAPGAGNIIAYNGTGGVVIGFNSGDQAVNNPILSNSIFANGYLGIDLGADGVTPNTPGGPHSGPNDLQNYPVLGVAVNFGTSTTVEGTLNSAPNTSYTVQFFASPTPSPTGHGQGQTYLGQTTVTTDGSGNASFKASLATAVPAGQVVSATATDPAGNTSEFSADVTAVSASPPAFAANDAYSTDLNTTLIVSAPGVLANDIPSGSGSLRAALVHGPAHGALMFHPDGSFTYTPTAGFTGVDTFTYRDAVGSQRSNVATVTISVNPKTLVVTNTNDSGPGSLRQAILSADASNSPGADTILFNIAAQGGGPYTIKPSTPLPAITHPTLVNGYSQPGAHPNSLAQGDNAIIMVALDGSFSGGDGLLVTAGGTTIRGLSITHFNDGVHLAGAGGDVIVGNFLGTDPTGMAGFVGDQVGLLIEGSVGARVGSTSPSDRNLISGNNQQGVLITQGSTGDTLRNNYIGVDVTGGGHLGNFNGGVVLLDAPNNTIGGPGAAYGNVISANNGDGIRIDSAGNGQGSTGTIVQGNTIGIDAAGLNRLGNSGAGVEVIHGSRTLIGGPAVADRNVISANFGDGVVVQFLPVGVVIQGNFLGTDPRGFKSLGNGRNGVNLYGTSGASVLGNLISGNSGNGVADGPFYAGNGGHNIIQGNLIGTDSAGVVAIGNGQDGLSLDSFGDVVGGTTATARNVISGNGQSGIALFGNTFGATIQGNRIGTDPSGTKPIGNLQDGVHIQDSASGNVVGGTVGGAANIIAYNGGAGIGVVFGAVGDSLLSNSIHDNVGLGIDLNDDGVTPNTPGGPHSGPNDLQNYPVLASAASTSLGTTTSGTLNSAPNSTFTIQLFASPAADPSGFGEGQTYLGQVLVTTDGNGNASFTFTTKASVPAGAVISATATAPDGSTSEFSADVTVASKPAAAASQTTAAPILLSPTSEAALDDLAADIARPRQPKK